MQAERVTVRELRHHGGAVVEDVARGHTKIVTRDGADVAELRPLRRRGPGPAALVDRRKALPIVDPVTLRADIDTWLDSSL